MNDWIPNQTEDNKEEISSIAGQDSSEEGSKESITQLGSSYEIKSVTKSKQTNRSIPTALLALVVIAPLVFVFAMGALSNSTREQRDDSFLFNSVESEYLTLTVDSEYSVDSVTDKQVPFLERHILKSTADGQKTLTLLVKDVRFDYSIEENLGAKARRENPDTYSEAPFELEGNQGIYFKKTKESFEHFILLVDRSKSVLYEITMESPTTFANDIELGTEFNDILNNITFLE